jgi:hypothetical protein
MESYQAWLSEGPELALLRMLGLFQRPADRQLAALLKPPALRGVTESLTGSHPTDWRIILAKLRRAKLLLWFMNTLANSSRLRYEPLTEVGRAALPVTHRKVFRGSRREQEKPTQSIAGKRTAPQEDMDSDYLFGEAQYTG